MAGLSSSLLDVNNTGRLGSPSLLHFLLRRMLSLVCHLSLHPRLPSLPQGAHSFTVSKAAVLREVAVLGLKMFEADIVQESPSLGACGSLTVEKRKRAVGEADHSVATSKAQLLAVSRR